MSINTIILIVGAVLLYLWVKPFYRSNEVINSWAQRNNLILRKKELRFIRVGPFFNRKNRAVYRVHLENDRGISKKAWVMIGDLFLIDSDKIRVIWDSPIDENSRTIKEIIYLLTALFYMVVIGLMVFLFIMLITNKDFGLGEYFIERAKRWD